MVRSDSHSTPYCAPIRTPPRTTELGVRAAVEALAVVDAEVAATIARIRAEVSL